MNETDSPKKMGFLERMKAGLAKTREGFVRRLDSMIFGRKIDEALLEELEELLITADFGVNASRRILEQARKSCPADGGSEALRQALVDIIRQGLERDTPPLVLPGQRPHFLLVVGVNGVGKTTTIGKLAAHYHKQGHKVMLAAGDTFRAAAVEQLKIWGKRADCPVVAQDQGADSASVIHDAFSAARAREMDLLIADTAGRLHTKSNLMDELKKVKRVVSRLDPGAPHDIWLVLDATTGQNALSQARQFHQDIGLTGLVVTKLDGTAKGGVVVAITEELHLPLRFIGVGEGIDDLKPFHPHQFVEALFSR